MPHPTIKLVSLLITPVFLTGCAMNGTQQRAQTPSQTTSPVAMSIMLEELAIAPSPQISTSQAIGPQLIAGDWLAWQCALSGSYWDMPTEYAPVFAEAHED